MRNIDYIKKIIVYLKPYWKEEILLLILIFINTGLTIIAPLLIGTVFDKGILSKNLTLVAVLSLIILSIYILRKVFEYFQSLLFGYVNQGMARDLRNQLFNKKLNLPLSYFSKNKPGEIMTILIDDVNTLSGLLSTLFVNGFSNVIIIIAISSTLLIKDFQLGIASLAILSTFVIVFKSFNKSFEKWGKIQRQNNADLKSKTEESVFFIRSIKSFSNEESEFKKFKDFSLKFLRDSMGAINLSGFANSIIGLVSMLGPLLVLFLGANEVIKGSLTIGGLIAFNTLLVQLYSPSVSLAQINFNFHQSIISIKRILSFLDEKEESSNGKLSFSGLKQDIVFKNVNFYYEPAKQVLRDIGFCIPQGSFVVLSGESGQGKSTMLDLLCRFIQPVSGQILIDNVNIQEFDIKSYRQKISAVNQDDFIRHATIKENICYGDGKSTSKDISKTIKMVNLDSFITLPESYDMIIGEKGSTLSGGQKRRISLARAFLRTDADILLLDEPSGGLDSESIKSIIDSIKSLRRQKTIIVASHEEEFIKEADLVFVLREGRLAEHKAQADLFITNIK